MRSTAGGGYAPWPLTRQSGKRCKESSDTRGVRVAARLLSASLLVAVLAAVVTAVGAPADPARAGSAPHRIAFGVYTEGAPWDRSAMDRFSAQVGRRPVIWHTYRSWDEDPFPADSLRNSADSGAVALVTWEPDGRDLSSIAGGRYDSYIRASAREGARWGRPLLLRFA